MCCFRSPGFAFWTSCAVFECSKDPKLLIAWCQCPNIRSFYVTGSSVYMWLAVWYWYSRIVPAIAHMDWKFDRKRDKYTAGPWRWSENFLGQKSCSESAKSLCLFSFLIFLFLLQCSRLNSKPEPRSSFFNLRQFPCLTWLIGLCVPQWCTLRSNW